MHIGMCFGSRRGRELLCYVIPTFFCKLFLMFLFFLFRHLSLMLGVATRRASRTGGEWTCTEVAGAGPLRCSARRALLRVETR